MVLASHDPLTIWASELIGMTTTDAIKTVFAAINPEALFGSDPKGIYRRYAKLLHEDVVAVGVKDEAARAFRKLSDFYSQLNGDHKPTEQVIGKWIVSSPLAKGDICDVYQARSVQDETIAAVFKLARSPRDSDLLENEYAHLGILHKQPDDHFKQYLPKVLDRVDASHRRANIVTLALESMSLADIGRLVGPSLDFKHCVWFVNRGLNALGFAHRAGIIHGAVLPEHLLFGPKSHLLVLVDWCYSVTAESKKHIPAIVKSRKDLYPAEVLRRLPAKPATDIYMLFASIASIGNAIPKRFKPIFQHALAASPNSRPADAWALLDRWLAVAREEYGPAKYLELTIPVN